MSEHYQVLARKYRPQDFHDLIGQEMMVRTLGNAFASGRIAHAFMLTGVRGIGKTTTARIIARGLNCVGVDGTRSEPTTEPCGECAPCKSIAEGRNIDVLELDAASNTQVEKMREILAGVPYRPSELRYKVYIFDEVHMLSNAAFNAILKTLEEPPEHVKFIFATTEIRKVPVTVLSRCQRFDLRRVEPERMCDHLRNITAKENAAISEEALRLIARAAEGSVRDALSILDQAIAIGQGETTLEHVRAMLGLADQGRVLDLYEAIMAGDVREALEGLRGLYHDGADPEVILRELAEITHFISLLKVSDQLEDETQSPEAQARMKGFSERLSLPVLARSWQMLLKLGKEIEFAPTRLMGAEMAIIRLCHVSNDPPPSELLAQLKSGGAASAGMGAKAGASSNANATKAQSLRQVGGEDVTDSPLARFQRFEQVIELVRTRKDVSMLIEIERCVRLASYKPGRIEFALTPDAASDFPQRLSQRLSEWTGARWGISLVQDVSAPTIAERREREKNDLRASIEESAIVKALRAKFPKAELIDIEVPLQKLENEDRIEPDLDDDWEALDLDDKG